MQLIPYFDNTLSQEQSVLTVKGVGADNVELTINLETGGLNILGWVVMLAPFAFVLIMTAGMNKLSFGTLSLLFMVFSILMGIYDNHSSSKPQILF